MVAQNSATYSLIHLFLGQSKTFEFPKASEAPGSPLLTHPAIADAAVIPIADEEAGQVPKAFVVLRSDVTTEEIQSFVALRVAPYKKLRHVEITDAIPRSPSGKILRRVLAERG